MKRTVAILLVCLLLSGCGTTTIAEVTTVPREEPGRAEGLMGKTGEAEDYVSRFDSVTQIDLTDTGIAVNGGPETEGVYTSRDIIYYEDRESYESGNPYGEGKSGERHSAAEAQAHTVVNITQPGAYRISGKLSAGQIRIDLGEDAYEQEEAIVELILADADITCTVAPAILFLNTYECDGAWSEDHAKPDVDTGFAGANLILEGSNYINGSHVAKIFKDKDGEKKLWKQDAAIYSCMSMNVYGPGALELTADNEGLGTELHLTIHGGDIVIRSQNDGINTNEDGVSVTTINGGNLHILAGLGEEGDGIDSNGFLVINGGYVISSAKPASDAGLDSDLGSYIHGGTVVALGSTMDWAESTSGQVTMNLQFAQQQPGSSGIQILAADGTVRFAFDPAQDPVLKETDRGFQGAILSCPAFAHGETYAVYVGGQQMQYTGSDLGFGGPGMGGRPGMSGGERPQMPENFEGQHPDDFQPAEGAPLPEGDFGGRGMGGQRPEGAEPPDMPQGDMPQGEIPQGGRGAAEGTPSTEFYMADMVNAFSGLCAAE